MKQLVLILFICLNLSLNAQSIPNAYQSHFNNAYNQYPQIPRGILEGVAFTQTHFKNIQNTNQGCIELPLVSGVMGLTENGAGYFRNNLNLVAQLSGYSASTIKLVPATNILAYAKAYAYLVDSLNISSNINSHDIVLKYLSEIPWDHNSANSFALNTFVYQVLSFVKNTNHQAAYNFPNQSVDLVDVFGINNYTVLSSQSIVITNESVTNSNNLTFDPQFKSSEYAPALWVNTPTCNRSSRSGTAITAVTIHTIQGTYAGAISWAQNCSANVSYHYVERSSDGQVTQMVLEANKAWHVGSHNPYTIGIEHEGYVNDASWYTTAMIQSSADLVRDITQSGYGISPLRTYYGASTSGVNVLGACTKIKGHQHFGNNTHTDPGINWDWENYYKLINNNPTVSSYTTANGTIYDTGGANANYSNDERELYLIEPTAATSVSLSFGVFNLEQNWDFMYIYDGNSTDSPLIGIFTGTSNPTTITSTGGSLLIEFRSDCATNAPGWELNWTSNIDSSVGDITPPITSINAFNNWNTAGFNASFNDADEANGSGLSQSFYQVIDFNGTEWRANNNNGFYSDNFDNTIHSDWTQQTSTWTINNSFLQIADEGESNTNIHTSLNQNNDNQFIYNWSGQISGSSSNKRAGIYIMCSDPTLNQRGNAYMIYFRTDDNKIEIYESVNNSISLEAQSNMTLNDNQWYDFKVIYDKLTGEILVYVDNNLSANWTDSSPITTGDFLSYRSGNCIYDINNLKVYHNRTANEMISVGVNGDIRYQNINSSTQSGKVKSIVLDSANNISAPSGLNVNIDWTTPSDIAIINDGLGNDIATFTNNNSISANWSTSSDPNSDISSYSYGIGTTNTTMDVLGLTDNWFDTTMTQTGLNLTPGTTYYIFVVAKNGAGLLSNLMISNGQTLQAPTNTPVANFTVSNSSVCSTDSLLFTNNSTDATTYNWSVPFATPSTSTDINPYFSFPSSGTYTITLTATGPVGSDVTSQDVDIDIANPITSSFTNSASTVYIPNTNVTFTNTSQNANGYLWSFDDGTTSIDTNPWHNFTQSGFFNVTCVAINGVCPNDTSTTTIEVINNVGISEVETNFKIYPNPTINDLTIEFDKTQINTQIQIIDLNGKVIISEIPHNQTHIINTSVLSKGMYFVKIISNEKVMISEFVKK